ncbi:MAG TPA: lysoplasmalogenase [Pyrinomonadaceae bacterium]|nr:lysoplasmalogenase [Pyrinomonadaceae bacterium]
MKQSATKISIIFSIALFAELFVLFFQLQHLQFFTKPSLMLILIFWFCANTRSLGSLKYWIISALIFSWFGDVFLLFEKQNKNLFIFGLASFLLAHLCYIVYFYQIRKENAVKFSPKRLISLTVLIYVVSLFSLLAPNLNSLQTPVFFYALTLAAMLLTSFHAFNFQTHSFAKICVAGTILFVVSDSVLAINRFYQPFEFANIMIMLTYAIAQFLITLGAWQNLSIGIDD